MKGEVVPGQKGVKWRGLTRCGGLKNLWSGGWTWARKRGGPSVGTPGCGGRKVDKKRKYTCGEMVREPREPAGRRPQGSADYGFVSVAPWCSFSALFNRRRCGAEKHAVPATQLSST